MEPLSALDYKLLLAVPLIPLVGYVVQIFFGKSLPRKGDWLLTTGMFVVMCITVRMFFKAIGSEGAFFHESAAEGGPVFDWLYRSAEKGEGLNISFGILFDSLGAGMLAVVGIVSFFVHLFSTGYMHGDRRYHIFFANISLFTVAMLALVLSDNLLCLFVFWEVMGLMSYLLIGHFSQDPKSHRITHAAAACKKAFLTTRVGDTCLLFGMAMFYFLLPKSFNELTNPAELAGGTFRFSEMWSMAEAVVAANGGEYPMWMTVAGLFVFGGTVGKSAQFPLHIWLPDAMEGPTPVSAMIHAATMVAAGVFLLGRTYPLMSPDVLMIVTAVGATTAIFAATIGCTVNDIKGVLAYSTISQLGFMVAAIGTGGLGLIAGLFHMVTHAFFKACLFLSAGSVIHGCHHEQDMRKMGGLLKKMPVTAACMIICTLAIAGMPLFSGFYSKDRILQAAFQSTMASFSGWPLYAGIALSIAACLTTFYMFRLVFMTFFGEPRDHHIHDHAHESPLTMTISLGCLAALGLFGGHFWLTGDVMSNHGTWFTHLVNFESLYPGVNLLAMNTPAIDHALLEEVLYPTQFASFTTPELQATHVSHPAHYLAVGVSLTIITIGIAMAYLMYYSKKLDPKRFTDALGEAYVAVERKYYIDELVNATVIKGTMVLARAQKWIDENLVDGIVNLVGKASKVIGFASAWFDKTVVDGLVNLVGLTTQAFGSVVRLFQTGRVQQYVSFAVAGGLLVVAAMILS